MICVALTRGGELPPERRGKIDGTTPVLKVVDDDLTATAGGIVVRDQMSVRHPYPERTGEIRRHLTETGKLLREPPGGVVVREVSSQDGITEILLLDTHLLLPAILYVTVQTGSEGKVRD